MRISKILNSLEKSWERDDILLKIKNGSDTDKIVNEFLENNKIQIRELNTLLRPEDINLLNQVEQLSTCESKLINEIKNLNYLENKESSNIAMFCTGGIRCEKATSLLKKKGYKNIYHLQGGILQYLDDVEEG